MPNSTAKPTRRARPARYKRALVAAFLLLLMLGLVGCETDLPTASSTTQYKAALVPVPVQVGDGGSGYDWGYVDTAGEWVIQPRFEEAWFFVGGPAPVELDGKWGYIDETGSTVIEPQFTEAYYFRDGLARVATGPSPHPNDRLVTASDYGFIDQTGSMVIAATWDDADDFHEGFAAVMRDSKCGFIDQNGELAIPLEFDAVGQFSEGLAQAQVDGKFGYIDTKGRWRIDPQYEGGVVAEGVLLGGTGLGQHFKSGLAPVYVEGTFLSGGTCQYIDRAGKKAFPQEFQYGGVFNEGLAPVCVDDKWGFIDTSGRMVIEPQYDHPMGIGPEFYLLPWNGFHDGLAPVALDHKLGYIDHTGTFVVAPQYLAGSGFFGGFAYVNSEELRNTSGVIDVTGSLIYRVSPTSDADSTISP